MTLLTPNISVLVNVWSGDDPHLLVRSLESVRNQTLAPAEIIICIDGQIGPENRAVIDDFLKLSVVPTRTIQTEVNRGLWFARNYGIGVATSPWVALHDADDMMHPERLARVVPHLRNGDIDVLGSAALEIGRPSGKILGIRAQPVSFEALKKRMMLNNPFNHSTVVVRREVVLALGGYRNVYLTEDYDLWMRLFHAGARMKNLPEPLTLFSVSDQQFLRRGGLAFFKSEMGVMRQKKNLGIVPTCLGPPIFLVRLGYRLLPSFLRKGVYGRFVSRRGSAPKAVLTEQDFFRMSPSEILAALSSRNE
jgi:glycosyltransferase involved in cell wall biosynthesis